MNELSATQIRKIFLDFFEEKGHKIVPSAPIVVKNDPTLMFTNAGMNQFKEYFLGNSNPAFSRIADTQKCLRVSGKHNDLEEVGVDTYHHTMFEMLGNWSFGDYFKKEAIAWSWELLTRVFEIPEDRMFATVFAGDEAENLPFDAESYEEWQKWLPKDRILKGSKKDNFWEMGDVGPCGPCTEIHIDCRSDEERSQLPGNELINADHPQVIEIWNNVFMEFNRLKDGSLMPLPSKHVDTGMGFERLVRVLQNKQSNYDTDVFSGTIGAIESITNKAYERGDDVLSISFRVIADHIRAIAFTIADGQLPAATGAGYVIRRILRRAVRYYYTYLEYNQPLLCQLIPLIANQYQDVFPELFEQKAFVANVIKEEELAFLKTLEKGIRRFEEYLSDQNSDTNYGLGPGIIGTTTDDIMKQIEAQKGTGVINGRFAFELYDTYGFPYDLTELMAKERGWVVDEAAFNESMKEQKERSRAATAIDTEDWQNCLPNEVMTFVGYDNYNVQTHVVRYRKVHIKNKIYYQIILATTPFYPEGGGQVGDKGVLIFDDEVITVVDTKKENDVIIHFTEALPKDISLPVDAKINIEERLQTTNNHTATHLVHAALRQVLGDHVHQKGSLVQPEELRFDIAHFAKMTQDQLHEVMQIVNSKIRANIPVVIKELPKDEALAMGAMALFGEKYGEVVRTVIIDPEYSVELCGGTHVSYTGKIGAFVIISESAVAAGVRRIVAYTGQKAIDYLIDKMNIVKDLTEQLKSKDIIKSVQQLHTEKSSLEKQIQAYEQQNLAKLAIELAQKATIIGDNIQFLAEEVSVSQMDSLKHLSVNVKNNLKQGVVLLLAKVNDKPMVALSISDELANIRQLNAGAIIKKEIAGLIKGGGGGSHTLATAGGSDAGNFEEIKQKVKNLLIG